MLISWYCCYTGLSKWHRTEVCEPDECCVEGQIEVDEEVWDDGDVLITCPKCGNTLTQYMDHFSEIK